MLTVFQQEEAIPESLKNILLVMADGGHLVPPSQDPSKEQIWTETKKRLERFLPALFVEIFPDAAAAWEKSAPVSSVSSPVIIPSTEKPAGEQEPLDGGADAGAANAEGQDGDEGEVGAEAGEAGEDEGNGKGEGEGEEKADA